MLVHDAFPFASRRVLLEDVPEHLLFTLPEMGRADAIMRDVYARAGGGDRYRCSFYPGPHKLDKHMQAEAFDWFGRWLSA